MTKVLIVDDSAVDRRLAGGLLERSYHSRIDYATDGVDALESMARQTPDIVVTDLQMPRMSGLELVIAVREKYPTVPVIVMTAQGSEDLAVQALKHGAASYLSKSRLADELRETIDSVLAVSRADRRHERVLEYLSDMHWSFVLENDITLIPSLVDQVRQDLVRVKLCDETSLTRMGIALHEALVNAIHHGNLELRSELRERDEQAYQRMAEQRRREAPYADRRVHVNIKVSPKEAVYVLRDEGPGFDPSRLPDPTDPANLERVCGRGLLLVRTFMDEVRHNATGNEITMIKRRES
ncbi:MAG TPA: response regulator [Pirellulales bacterium]|jgi:CheY-like chemotaxis protein/anti-sigma regulatory factor (Ser/Thr protein kinase)|nr:response regulator [Pirellulales bacterium]